MLLFVRWLHSTRSLAWTASPFFGPPFGGLPLVVVCPAATRGELAGMDYIFNLWAEGQRMLLDWDHLRVTTLDHVRSLVNGLLPHTIIGCTPTALGGCSLLLCARQQCACSSLLAELTGHR